MIRSNFRAALMLAIGISVVSVAVGQQRRVSQFTADKYLISARAGGVNYIDGTVTVVRPAGKSGVLLRDDQLEVGDRVSTGTDGRAEVLLNPGSYLRAGADSVFEFKTVSLDDLQIKLERGSALFEVFATDEFTVTIGTPRGRVTLIESGVYRIDVTADGNGTIAVTEGRALVDDGTSTEIKKGRTGTITGGVVTVAKFDRGRRDELAEWGRSRAKDLAKMTTALRNSEVRTSLLSSFNNGRWGMYDSFGLWVFNPFARSYCFLPFGYGWYSPYGFGYGTGLYWYNLPPVIHLPPVVVNNTSNHGVKPPRTRPIDTEPPYAAVERTREPIRSIRPPEFPTDTSRDTPSPIRVYQPPPPPPTVYVPASPPPGAKSRDN